MLIGVSETARRRAEDDRAAGQAALARSEAAASDRFTFELELEKVRREVTRLTEDLARAQSEITMLRTSVAVKEAQLDAAAAAAREAAARESASSQTRLNLTEKLDAALEKLKAADKDRERVAELEGRLGKDQRALLSAEGTFRDQIHERNTLLLTVWNHLEKILGVDTSVRIRFVDALLVSLTPYYRRRLLEAVQSRLPTLPSSTTS